MPFATDEALYAELLKLYQAGGGAGGGGGAEKAEEAVSDLYDELSRSLAKAAYPRASSGQRAGSGEAVRPLSWKPERRGSIFCSPACGAGCTYVAYELAGAQAHALISAFTGSDLEWIPRVWENLGWHWEIRSKCGRFSLWPSHGVFHAHLNVPGGLPGGRWVGVGTTAADAIEGARRQARAHLAECAVCVDATITYTTRP